MVLSLWNERFGKVCKSRIRTQPLHGLLLISKSHVLHFGALYVLESVKHATWNRVHALPSGNLVQECWSVGLFPITPILHFSQIHER